MSIETVLLVDDEPDIRTIGEMALHDVGGWRVLTAASGAEALELIAEERPDLVLLDVMMPVMDGPSTLAALRREEATASIPVVFLTAKVQAAEVERYLALGAMGVLRKPFDPLSLADELREIVGASA